MYICRRLSVADVVMSYKPLTLCIQDICIEQLLVLFVCVNMTMQFSSGV